MRVVFRLSLLLIVALASGCYSFSASPHKLPRPVETAHPLQWPQADCPRLESLRASTPEQIFQARLLSGRTLESLKTRDERDLVSQPWYTIKRNEIMDGALVRWYQKKDEVWIALQSLFTGFNPNGSVLTERDLARGDWKLMQMRAAATRAQINKAWAESGFERDPTEWDVGIDEGIPFRLPTEIPEGCKGIVLHLWALAGNEYEQAVAEEVRAHGWLVVDIKPRSGAPRDVTEAGADRIIALERERDAMSTQLPHMEKGESRERYQKRLRESPAYLRQIEISAEVVAIRNPPLELCSEADIAGVAAELTGRIDAVLVQNAQAVRAVLETTRRVYPSLRSSPVVVMGFSAGALSTPTVAALLGPEVSSVVIVGGAANLLAVSQRSELTKGGVRLTCNGKPPPPALLEKLEAEYLARGRFDGYHAAPLLASRPVLVVDAGMDTWVPSDLGDLLFERLGRPDRLHMSLGGHAMLFYLLPRRSAWLANWIDEHAVASREAVAESGQGSGGVGAGSK